MRVMSSCLFSLREALPGLDSQAAGNHTYYHRSRQGVAAPSATLDSHELESLMSPLPEDAPVALGDITELTEVHSLIHTSLPEDIIHGKRKVRTPVCGDWAPTLGKSLCLVCHCWEARSDPALAPQSLGCRLVLGISLSVKLAQPWLLGLSWGSQCHLPPLVISWDSDPSFPEKQLPSLLLQKAVLFLCDVCSRCSAFQDAL